MTEVNQYEVVLEALRDEAQAKLPERCRGCGHFAVGLARVAEDVVEQRMNRDEATYEIDVAATETDAKCKFGYVESKTMPGNYMCSFELKDSKNDTYYMRNRD